jgi:hypothetical protein
MTQHSVLRVNPIDSADIKDIESNIETNLGLVTEWLKPVKDASGKIGVLIGAGPSLGQLLKSGFIHKDMFPSDKYVIFTCKHALPLLMEYGFKNIYCTVLDPRHIEGISTHDVKRLSLYEVADVNEVTFLLATMTEPSVTTYLLDRGYKVLGWNADSLAIKKFKERVPFVISGGTNSILRSVGIGATCFGIREFHLIGLDSSLPPPPKEVEKDLDSYLYTAKDEVTGSPKYLKSFCGSGDGLHSNKYIAMWTTGELAAQLADVESFFTHAPQMGLKFNVLGTDKGRSLIGQLADSFGII